jgi:hypothetical protein
MKGLVGILFLSSRLIGLMIVPRGFVIFCGKVGTKQDLDADWYSEVSAKQQKY